MLKASTWLDDYFAALTDKMPPSRKRASHVAALPL